MAAPINPSSDRVPTAKLFMHGRSQAVRLPKAFRFSGTEVRVSKVGDKVILEPMATTAEDIAAVFATIDQILGDEDFLAAGAPEDLPAPPDPRRFFE